ncbi:MAG: ferritin [Ilumatobacteraceae bacterium]
MAAEELHVPRERLTEETYTAHLAITSLMEELEAIDWYRQRADDCTDEQLKAVLTHNMDDEMEHAAMLIEWLRRNIDEFATQLNKFSKVTGTTGPIAKK